MPKYDVVISGAGLAGLACGLILSKNGMKVCIVEKNSKIGGCLQNFSRKGVTFDTGVHYIGSLDDGQILERCFSYLGLTGRVPLRRMNEDGYDIITFGDDENIYRHPMGSERYTEVLSSMFPEERGSIKRYCEILKSVNDSFPINNLKNGEGSADAEYFSTNTINFLRSVTNNKKLQDVMAGSNLLYAGISDHTPMFIHSLINYSYMQSAYRIVGGSEQVADILSDRITKNGGEIFTDTEIVRFIHNDDGTIKAAAAKNGEVFEGSNFISTIHPSLSVRMIDPMYIRKAFVSRIAELENTISVFGLYIVLKEGCFGYTDSNFYHYRGSNVWTAESYESAEWPENFFMSITPQSADEKYARGINVLSYMKFNDVGRWSDTTVGRRGEEYRNFKEMKAHAVISLIEKRFPGFTGMIDSYYTSTPLTYRDYTATVAGSIYGISRDSGNFVRSHISAKTKIPNLFFAGQNVSLHGVLGVAVSSVITCGNITGLDSLVNQIRNC